MRFLMFLVLLVALPSALPGAIVYDMLYRAGEFESFDGELKVDPGSQLTGVEILLRETVTAGEDSALEGGLRTFYVDLRSTSPDSVLNLAPTSDFVPAGTAADLENPLSGFVPFGAASAERIDVSTVEVVLGTADFLGPQSGSRTFSLADAEADEPNMVLANNDPIDGSITYRTLTLTAIPEPSAVLGLMGLGAVVSLRRRSRRRA